MIPVLLLMIIIPLLGAASLFLFRERHSGKIAIATTLIEITLAFFSLYLFKTSGNIAESFSYIPQFSIQLGFELNIISVFLVLLTSIVFFAASFANEFFIKEERRSYNALFLVTEAPTLGLFLSSNLFLFFIFWEVSIIALFFIIFHFGGYDRRYASIKFLSYSILSSGLLLVGILLLYFSMPVHTFSIAAITAGASAIPATAQTAIFILLMIAFMIKIPIFPFHLWVPDAYSEASPAGSMLLAGVLSKFGAYGMLLLFMILPVSKEYALYFAPIIIFSIIYSAIVALAQKEIKRMFSYLSIAEMGFVAFGIAEMNIYGFSGALFGMLSHAMIISLLFIIAYAVDKTIGTTVIRMLHGIVDAMPILAYATLFGVFAAVGLPLTSSFINDILIAFGGFKAFSLLGLAPLAMLIINGAYLFWLIGRSFISSQQPARVLLYPSRSLYAAVFILAAFIIIFGVVPQVLLGNIGALI
ncbi:MAG: NADH-quinone oxidoreductase subunit M [Candidatus Micrarchaeaceae archaeon]